MNEEDPSIWTELGGTKANKRREHTICRPVSGRGKSGFGGSGKGRLRAEEHSKRR